MKYFQSYRRTQIRKCILKKNSILIIGTVMAAILAVIIFIPLNQMNLSVKTIYGISMPGNILMNLLKMMILPLVVLSLLSGLTSLNITTSGKLGLYTVIYFLSTTFIAVCLGIFLVLLIRPGNMNVIQEGNYNSKTIDPINAIFNLFHNLFPDNIMRSTFQQVQINFINKSVKYINRSGFKNNTKNITYLEKYQDSIQVSYADSPNFLGLIFFSIFFGIILNTMGSKAEALVTLINIMNDLVMRMVDIILLIIPIGIFFLVLSNLLSVQNLESILQNFGFFVLTILTGLTIHVFIILPAVYVIFTRKNPYRIILGMSRAMLVAFVTQSSSITLPVTMKCAEENNKIDPRISKFLFPIGAIINMDGTGLYEAVAAIFIAQINDIKLSSMDLIKISCTSTLAAIGAAATPSAGLVILLIVLTTVGLPTHQVALLYTFDWILDRCRTTVNILGDAFGASILQSLCKKDFGEEIIRNTGRQSVAVIREIYESGKSEEDFEKELDAALNQSINIIIIEPEKLGENAWKWIYLGNLIHRKAILSSLFCVGPTLLFNFTSLGKQHFWQLIFTGSTVLAATTSVICSCFYSFLWVADPCSKYQIENDEKRLHKIIPFSKLTSSSCIVIVRKDYFGRRILQWSASLIGVGICASLIYKMRS